MEQSYLLEWLDLFISVTLNPAGSSLAEITTQKIPELTQKVQEEKYSVQQGILNRIFTLDTEGRARLMIRNYHRSLVSLHDKLMEYQDTVTYRHSTTISHLAASSLNAVEEIISFIENRFSGYVDMEDRAPSTYAQRLAMDILSKASQMKKSHTDCLEEDKPFVAMILNHLNNFAAAANAGRNITYGYLYYVKAFVQELERYRRPPVGQIVFTDLHRRLIYLNYNSRKYLNLLTTKIAGQVNSIADIAERVDMLHRCYKEFKQLHHNPALKLNPNYVDVAAALHNWFTQEIYYLEKQTQVRVEPISGKTRAQKVVCNLSSDQVALILRASDELKIISARSMNELFKTIVPHLSTPHKKDLSADSVRSKSYVAEQNDKQAAIAALESIIRQIEKY